MLIIFFKIDIYYIGQNIFHETCGRWENIQKHVVVFTILLIVLLTVSTVNATDIMANNTVGDYVVHESDYGNSATADDENLQLYEVR